MTITIRELERVPYQTTYDAMRDFNTQRVAGTVDEVWLLEHPSVYTLGLSGNREHLLNTGNIPVIETDRGGQVTYHGPGQLIAYLLLDLGSRPYAIKTMVKLIEQSVIDYLHSLGVVAERKERAPGVYVNGKKIAALGVRVKKGCTYHGLALNVDMDLSPFNGINPCGYEGLQCTQLADLVQGVHLADVKKDLPAYLIKHLDVTSSVVSHVA